MDRFEPNLRIPGPTALPPTVREVGGRQMINHRGPEFAAMLKRILDGMRPFFGTSGDIAMLSCAGTGGLEAAVVNTLSPGDRVLGVSIGAFGDRFAKVASVYGANVTKLDVAWGQAAQPGAAIQAFWEPVTTRSTPHSSMANGTAPSADTLSTRISVSGLASRTAAASSGMGFMTPVDVSLWVSRTARKGPRAASASRTATGSAACPHSTSSLTTSAP